MTSTWSSSMPKNAGAYEIRCMETNYDPSRVSVYWFDHELWVEDEHVGKYPIKSYHDGLTNLEWRSLDERSLSV